jgi:hypothetical protein
MSRMMTYDTECYSLARHFTSDQTRELLVIELAQHIQASIEDYLENVEFQEDAARIAAADRAAGI